MNTPDPIGKEMLNMQWTNGGVNAYYPHNLFNIIPIIHHQNNRIYTVSGFNIPDKF